MTPPQGPRSNFANFKISNAIFTASGALYQLQLFRKNLQSFLVSTFGQCTLLPTVAYILHCCEKSLITHVACCSFQTDSVLWIWIKGISFKPQWLQISSPPTQNHHCACTHIQPLGILEQSPKEDFQARDKAYSISSLIPPQIVWTR